MPNNSQITSSLDILENDPKILNNLLLIHFPIFPMNQSYLQDLTEIMKFKFSEYEK